MHPEPLNLFYVGQRFYWDSGSAMSSIYEEGTLARSDWGKVNIALQNGREVHIRPATGEEYRWAEAKLREQRGY